MHRPRIPLVVLWSCFAVAASFEGGGLAHGGREMDGASEELAEDEAPDAGRSTLTEEEALPGPVMARGPLRPVKVRAEAKACSFRNPICIHSGPEVPSRVTLAALASADRAWDLATGALELPAPDPDPVTRAYDVYLVDMAAIDPARGMDRALTVFGERDVRSRIDRASAFTLLDRAVSPGCEMDALLAREVTRASLWRAAPATEEGTARAQTTYLAQLMVPCAMAMSADGVAAFQNHPERAFVDTWPHADRAGELFDRGASLFYGWLDFSFGARPGALVRASWALAPTKTDLSAFRWHNEPDTFDVLRSTFRNTLSTKSTVEDLFLEFAVARAFFGPSADDTHYPESRPLGEAARVRTDWEIDWPEKPRRLAAAAHPMPLGSSVIKIRHENAPKGARLRVEAAWEQHAKMKWAVVKVDKAGREIGHIVIPSQDRATETQMTVVDLDDVPTILIVGVNTGDALYPFDPDDEVWEPHSWLLTVAVE